LASSNRPPDCGGGAYRLARAAAKFGPEICPRDLLDRFSYDCLWRAEARGKRSVSACGVYLPDLEQPRPPELLLPFSGLSLIQPESVDAVFRACLYAFLLGRSLLRREIAMPKRLGLLWMLSLYLSAGSVCRAAVADHPEPDATKSIGRAYLRFLTIDPSLIEAPNAAPLPSVMQAPNLPPRANAPQQPPASAQRPSETPASPGGEDRLLAQKPANKGEGEDITAAALESVQSHRDELFNTLKASAAGYTFDYVVITLPANSLPGISVPIPVSHIRYRETVFFAFDEYSLQPRGEAAVLDFAKAIKQDDSIRSILIVGHTDSIGADEYNVTLSKNRATAVAMVLRNNGVTEKYLGLVPREWHNR
jgi:outer membrane protein OmpA-like peptidoglycan-associated protein